MVSAGDKKVDREKTKTRKLTCVENETLSSSFCLSESFIFHRHISLFLFFSASLFRLVARIHNNRPHQHTMMKMPSSLPQALGFGLLIVSLLLTSSDAFATTKTKAAASKPVAADQAVAIFGKTFPYGRPPLPPSARVRFGMPTTDFDGTTVMQEKYKNPGKRLVDITEKEARAAFVELAKCYGDQEALQMVKATPICLSFNKNNFKPSLEAFADIFGKQEAQQMVQRNPGLLALNPESAAMATFLVIYRWRSRQRKTVIVACCLVLRCRASSRSIGKLSRRRRMSLVVAVVLGQHQSHRSTTAVAPPPSYFLQEFSSAAFGG